MGKNDQKIEYIRRYVNEGKKQLESVRAYNTFGVEMPFEKGIIEVVGLIKVMLEDRQIILVGNGGSAAIASEAMGRFQKFCNIKALTFNDLVILTGVANDYGWEQVFTVPFNTMAMNGDLLFAISSSGKSKNILNIVEAAKTLKCGVITLSGFDIDNPLKEKGEINFYVPSNSYRHVERTHLFILDCIVDLLIDFPSE